jgi:hypothetical protein
VCGATVVDCGGLGATGMVTCDRPVGVGVVTGTGGVVGLFGVCDGAGAEATGCGGGWAGAPGLQALAAHGPLIRSVKAIRVRQSGASRGIGDTELRTPC